MCLETYHDGHAILYNGYFILHLFGFYLVMFHIRIRALVGIMIFFGYFLMYVVRYNLSVHVLDMNQMLKLNNKLFFNYTDVIKRASFGRARSLIGDNWDDLKISRLFCAYHIGYCVCFPVFYNIGDRIGPTMIVGTAGITSGVLNCLTPAAAYQNFWLLFVVRLLKGTCAGAMQPSMIQLLRHWVPPIERIHFMWAYCGITAGTFSTFLICAAVHYYARWPVGFYIAGGLQIFWSILWIGLVTDYPATHPFIARDELIYLSNTIGTVFTIKMGNSQTPWKLILKSKPFWALCILNFGYSWMICALSLHGPLYYCRVVGYPIYAAAALTALAFFLRLVIGTIVIQTLHWYKHNVVQRRIKHFRKYFIVVSHVIPGMMVSSMWISTSIPGPILLTTAIALTGAGTDLTLDLCYELSPTFVNSLSTVIKIIGNTTGIIISLLVGIVTYDYTNNPYTWKHIWCFHAAVLLISGIIFLIWGETHTQPWNSHRFLYVPSTLSPRLPPRPSAMSNIAEVDEDEISAKQSRKSSFIRSLRLSKV